MIWEASETAEPAGIGKLVDYEVQEPIPKYPTNQSYGHGSSGTTVRKTAEPAGIGKLVDYEVQDAVPIPDQPILWAWEFGQYGMKDC